MLEKSLSEFKKWIKLANLNENNHQIEGIKWCLQREFKSNSLEDDNSIFQSLTKIHDIIDPSSTN